MRNIFLFVLVAIFLTGCVTTKEVVRVEHIVVAPQDNLLVDCDVQAPPTAEQFLRGLAPEPAPPQFTLVQEQLMPFELYVKMLRTAEDRGHLQTELNLKNYQYLDTCNQRWAKLREWKVEAMKLQTHKKE
jgi:hypothetical protein